MPALLLTPFAPPAPFGTNRAAQTTARLGSTRFASPALRMPWHLIASIDWGVRRTFSESPVRIQRVGAASSKCMSPRAKATPIHGCSPAQTPMMVSAIRPDLTLFFGTPTRCMNCQGRHYGRRRFLRLLLGALAPRHAIASPVRSIAQVRLHPADDLWPVDHPMD